MTLSDTPAAAPTWPPPTRAEQIKAFIGDLARPFAIISTSAGASVATVIIAQKVTGFAEAALFIGAVFTGVGALYTAKAWEVARTGKHAAEVEVAKVQAGASSGGQQP